MQQVPGQAANTTRYVHGGYVYHVDTTSIQIFRCATRSSTGCTEEARIRDDETVQVYKPHVGHELNETILQELEMRNEMLEAATTTNTPLKEIFDAVCRRNAVIAPKLIYSTMKSSMQRARAKVRPVIPESLRELGAVLQDYAPTQELFRGLVEGEDGSVALIFSSDQLLEALGESTELYVDGTFKVAPYHPRIVQLYTMHIRVADTGVAAVYALCGARTRALYVAILTRIVQLAPGLRANLRVVMGDYERAAMSAVRVVFPEASLHGCWFHYAQAVERRWRRLGLTGVDRSILSKAMALPLAPSNRFDEGLAILADFADRVADEHPTVLHFLRYLRTQWSPLSDVVSVYGCPTRTNNLVESFHNDAKRRLGGLHPNVWKFIEYLRDLIVDQGLDLTRLQNGARPRRPRTIRNMARDTLIRNAQHDLSVDRLTLAEFLQRCATRTNRRLGNDNADDQDAERDDLLVDPGVLAAGDPRAEAPGARRIIRAIRRNQQEVQVPDVQPAAAGAVEVHEPAPLQPRLLQPPPLPQNDEAILEEPYNKADFHLPEDEFEVFVLPEDPVPFVRVQRDVDGILPNADGATVGQQNDARPRGTCCICLSSPATHALFPCGHHCCCPDCATEIAPADLCPLCRTPVTEVRRVIVDI